MRGFGHGLGGLGVLGFFGVFGVLGGFRLHWVALGALGVLGFWAGLGGAGFRIQGVVFRVWASRV